MLGALHRRLEDALVLGPVLVLEPFEDEQTESRVLDEPSSAEVVRWTASTGEGTLPSYSPEEFLQPPALASG